MHLVRQFAAYEMLSKPMQYETFLPAIEGLKGPPMLRAGEQLTVPLVVSRLVVVNGMEAEHVMIQALASLLQVSIGVVYADGEAMPQVRSCFHSCSRFCSCFRSCFRSCFCSCTPCSLVLRTVQLMQKSV